MAGVLLFEAVEFSGGELLFPLVESGLDCGVYVGEGLVYWVGGETLFFG